MTELLESKQSPSDSPGAAISEVVDCAICGADDGVLVIAKAKDPYLGYMHPLEVVVCRQCGLCYMRKRPGPGFLAAAYQDQYTGREQQEPDAYYRIRKSQAAVSIANWLAARLGNPSQAGKLLDVGSGGGMFLMEMASRNWQVSGIEPHPGFARYCRQELGLNIWNGSLEEFPGESNSFDLVTMIQVLEHISDPRKVLGVCHQLLKPYGQLLVEVPNVSRVTTFRKGGFFRADHLYYFSYRALARLLAEVGFEVEHHLDGWCLRVLARKLDPPRRSLSPAPTENCGSVLKGIGRRWLYLPPYFMLRWLDQNFDRIGLPLLGEAGVAKAKSALVKRLRRFKRQR